MLSGLVYLLTYSFVLACSDCFSKCSNKDLDLCLISCNCPLFTPSQVFAGSFQGESGLIFVQRLNKEQSQWVSTKLSCDLTCSNACSSKHLDSRLETCVKSCGCGALLGQSSVEENYKEKCDNLCKGSSAGCALDCYSHFEGPSDTWYYWVVIPIVFLTFLMAWLTIQNNKEEDDYILMRY